MGHEITHHDGRQLVAPRRLREILREDGEACYCAPEDWEGDWDAGECPRHHAHAAHRTHRPAETRETKYSGCRLQHAGDHPSHGGIQLEERCRCGAIRVLEINGRHKATSGWVTDCGED